MGRMDDLHWKAELHRLTEEIAAGATASDDAIVKLANKVIVSNAEQRLDDDEYCTLWAILCEIAYQRGGDLWSRLFAVLTDDAAAAN